MGIGIGTLLIVPIKLKDHQKLNNDVFDSQLMPVIETSNKLGLKINI